MQLAFGDRLGEVLRLAQGHGLQGGDDDERRPPVGQEPLDGPGPLDEAVVHGLEQDEELGDVGQELRAQDAVGHLVEGPRGQVDQPRAVGNDQPPQQAAREELGHALGGIEEVEGVAGGGRVHHDQVVDALGMDLEQALHGDVVVALDEAARDVAVEGVGQDLVAGAVVGGMVTDQGVPRLLGVEHGGVELAPGLDAGRGEGLVRDPSLGVADAVEPEGVGQAAGRVDGEDEDLARRRGRRPSPPPPPPSWSCPRRRDRRPR